MKSDLRWMCLFLGICSSWKLVASSYNNRGVNIAYQWSNLEFDYQSTAARQAAINSGEFVLGNAIPIDVDVIYFNNNRNKVFITIPRFEDGIPATLGVISERFFNGKPIITPYPSWRWHQNPTLCNADRMISVFRVKIDECGRLWVVDSGQIGEKQICPPQILAFDTRSNALIYRYEIPGDYLESNSLFVTINVDVRDSTCSDTFVYLADCQVPALVVHDVRRGTTWKIVDKTMYPNPDQGTFNMLGVQFDLMDGILGMDLSPYKPGQDRILFFHALTSITENWVFTSDIRNHSLFLNNHSPSPNIFHTYPGRRNSQVPAMAIDRNGIAYFGEASDTSMSCWNTETLYGKKNIDVLYHNTETMQFPSGVKVINNKRGGQELWFLTMRFQRTVTGTLNLNEVNFRIQNANIDELTRGSKCITGQDQENHISGNNFYRPTLGGGYGFNRNNNSNGRPGQTAVTPRPILFPVV